MSRFGMYVPPTTAQRASGIADRIESVQSPAIWHPANEPQQRMFLETQ